MQTSSRQSRQRSDAASRWWPPRCVTNPMPTHSSAPSCSRRRGGSGGDPKWHLKSETKHCLWTILCKILYICVFLLTLILVPSSAWKFHQQRPRSSPDPARFQRFHNSQVCSRLINSKQKRFMKIEILEILVTVKKNYQTSNLAMSSKLKIETWTGLRTSTFFEFQDKSLMIPSKHSRPHPPFFHLSKVEVYGVHCIQANLLHWCP